MLALFLAAHLAVYQLIISESSASRNVSSGPSIELQLATNDLNATGSPLACVGALSAFVVVVPLLEADAAFAAATLSVQLASWDLAPPCLPNETSTLHSTLAIAWVGPAHGASDSATAELRELILQLLRPFHGCFGQVELFDRHALSALVPPLPFPRQGSCNETTVSGLTVRVGTSDASGGGEVRFDALSENTVFLGVANLARDRSSALLWFAPGTHALQPAWLVGIMCDVLEAPSAWIIGSPLLMDCELDGGWEPTPSCCDIGPRLSTFHLGPTALFMTRDPSFFDYLLEWYSGELFTQVTLPSHLLPSHHPPPCSYVYQRAVTCRAPHYPTRSVSSHIESFHPIPSHPIPSHPVHHHTSPITGPILVLLHPNSTTSFPHPSGHTFLHRAQRAALVHLPRVSPAAASSPLRRFREDSGLRRAADNTRCCDTSPNQCALAAHSEQLRPCFR